MADYGRETGEPERDEPNNASPRRTRRLAGSLILVAGLGSGVIVVLDPAVGAALGTVVSVLVALDGIVAPRAGRRSRR